MCNRYQIKSDLHSLARELLAQPALNFEIPPEIFPKTHAPVVVINRDGKRELRPMIFGMGGAPDGGTATSRSRYPLNNTRIESHDKWPWKKPFEKNRCVVPMSSFGEACYWGSCEGTEVSFSATDDRMLLAAGLFAFEKTGDGEFRFSMSILMRPALDYVMQHGHHRSPFLIRPDGIDDWMDRQPRDADESLEILRRHADAPELQHTIDRQMAPSWVKRQAANLKKRDEQVAF